MGISEGKHFGLSTCCVMAFSDVFRYRSRSYWQVPNFVTILDLSVKFCKLAALKFSKVAALLPPKTLVPDLLLHLLSKANGECYLASISHVLFVNSDLSLATLNTNLC